MNPSNLARRLQEFEASERLRANEPARTRTKTVTVSTRRSRRTHIQIRDSGLRPFRVL